MFIIIIVVIFIFVRSNLGGLETRICQVARHPQHQLPHGGVSNEGQMFVRNLVIELLRIN
jgi:hypothetical protein